MQFFKQQLSLYYNMDAPYGRFLSVPEKSLTAIAQEYSELYWTNPESNILQNSSYTATSNPSLKASKSDEQDTLDTSGKERTSS